MAPEVFMCRIEIHSAVDIWSLGCCVLEMCTGKPPWHQYRFDNLLHAYHVISKPDALPDIPETTAAKGFIRRCLVREPKERATAAQLLEHEFMEMDEVR